jgi:hypothetical protein
LWLCSRLLQAFPTFTAGVGVGLPASTASVGRNLALVVDDGEVDFPLRAVELNLLAGHLLCLLSMEN